MWKWLSRSLLGSLQLRQTTFYTSHDQFAAIGTPRLGGDANPDLRLR